MMMLNNIKFKKTTHLTIIIKIIKILNSTNNKNDYLNKQNKISYFVD